MRIEAEVNQVQYTPPLQEDATWLRDLFGKFQTVSTAPTAAPKKAINQIQIYSSGGTWKLYVYDTVGKVWKSVTLS